MKILFLSNNLKLGGKEKQLFLLTQGLDKNGIDYKVILRYNVRDFHVPDERIILLNRTRGLGLIIRLRNIFKEYQPDIIHAWEGYFSIAGSISSLGLNIPFINGSIRYSRKFPVFSKTYIMQQLLSNLTTVTVANSLCGLKSFRFVMDKRHRVITNGININDQDLDTSREDLSKSDNSFHIGMVASFSEAKDFETLIGTGIVLLDEGFNIQITLVGDGPTKKTCMKMVPAKYEKLIKFTGKVTDPISFIKYFDVGILINHLGHAEGMSNSIMEYMSMKKPVIATNSGGNTELVTDGQNGFLIDYEDARALREKIIFLINNRESGSSMGQKGFQWIKERYSTGSYVQNWIKLYMDISK